MFPLRSERSTENEDNISGHEFTEIYDRSFPLSLSLSLSPSLSTRGPIFRNESPPRCTGPCDLNAGETDSMDSGYGEIWWKRKKKKEKKISMPRTDSTASTIPPTTCRVTWPGRIFSLPLFSSLTPSRGLTPSAANSFVESVHRDSSRRGIFVFVGWNVSFCSLGSKTRFSFDFHVY